MIKTIVNTYAEMVKAYKDPNSINVIFEHVTIDGQTFHVIGLDETMQKYLLSGKFKKAWVEVCEDNVCTYKLPEQDKLYRRAVIITQCNSVTLFEN